MFRAEFSDICYIPLEILGADNRSQPLGIYNFAIFIIVTFWSLIVKIEVQSPRASVAYPVSIHLSCSRARNTME